MQRLDGKSLDLTQENINALKQLFPEIVTEGKIDFDKIKLILGEEIETRKGKYEFTWHGKTQAIKLAQTPSTGTLRPDKESSKNWDTTENLYIEGDNLEVLKLLQKSYFGKIKMIYIDPPYNTGKDFVYKDDFRDNIKNYKELTHQTTKANTESNGRYHTDWLNMMYPRLKLARNLLTEDGVIFISIDDNEVANLKKILDEVFGEENFVGTINWKGKGGGADNKYLMVAHEYIILYSKNKSNFIIGEEIKEEENYNKYDEFKGKRYKTQLARKWGANSRREDRPNLFYGVKAPDDSIVYPTLPDGKDGCWRWSKDRMKKKIEEGNIEFIKDDNGQWILYEKIYEPDEGEFNTKKYSTWFDNLGNTAMGTKEIKEIFDGKVFDFPKPSLLIKTLIKISGSKDTEIILDFFSGSATTAHAVMQLNAEDGGNRKFIMVQLPEQTPEDSEAYKAVYKNICEIGIERIRRAGEKIKQGTGKEDLDIGFKVFKLDSSNLKAWDPDFENLEQNLFDLQENIKKDRTKEDLLYEILLKIGIPLTTQIEEIDFNGRTIYNVAYGSVLLCLEDNIDQEIVNEMIKLKPEGFDTKFIFKESGFISDSVKTNAIQTLKKNGITDVRSV
ncbi:site-specific DNA-methyltransferase [Tepidibacillus infernus]|uniref:site-specific DNA-methyltransferase n=1 Tax=Tepidibacillus infernus TaxID=1806172 RepID=UPI003B6D3E40